MAWRDRDYARDERPSFGESPLMWLLTGRVFLFRFWGVDVYAHASLLILIAFILLLGTPFGATVQDRIVAVCVLFGVILLHEFGHIWGARVSGGEANEIEMTPLGGLALVMPRRGPWPGFVTIACGPLVNVIICLVAGAVLFWAWRFWPLGPFEFVGIPPERISRGWLSVGFYAFYIYSVSYFLLLFNLLPIYPLDGGRLLQCILWFRISWYRATLFATAVGLVGAVLLVMFGIARTATGGGFGLLMALIGVMCFINCLRLRQLLKAEGPWAFEDEDEPDWMASVRMDPEKPEKVGFLERRRRAREERAALAAARAAEALERDVDEILVKISRHGRDSLTAREKRVLEQATAAKRGGR